MARWRVLTPHYILAEQFGEPTEWVREETNRDTGRAFRKTYKVPLYIDPNEAFYARVPSGMCVVALPGSERPGDIVFHGEPTPDMEPLDDEAAAISERQRHLWKSPIDNLPINIGEDFNALLTQTLEKSLSEAMRNATAPPQQAQAVAPSSEVAELRKLVEQLQQQIVGQANAAPVVDKEPPLENIDPDAIPSMPPPTTPPSRPTLRR